ncbi:mandelate racemase/muconate lactonizing enzyme family protein [Desulfosediminicola flagellatus]|uniref:mandelate racemase/muconate lactonizing enzyme family protein n=1 Tax=Desulfosediminicola flagellatus TaxID=2569541 RepID=UPI0010AB9417|nr:enolase C-terminal domain-like protein [Desulfosediminicola flagellatus]
MATIQGFELYKTDIPFKNAFKHAAASRKTSSSIMLKCITDANTTGYGECLPRDYVTGEKRDETFRQLKEIILPKLIGMKFSSMDEVVAFLSRCNGKAPKEWLSPDIPQTAAWAAVDLALLDAFGQEFDEPVSLSNNQFPAGLRYSAVFSADKGFKAFKSLLKFRMYGFKQVKLKVEKETAEETARFCRFVLGKKFDIRVDANMAWNVDEAQRNMKLLAGSGIRSFEQPLKADDIHGLSQLVSETGLEVMADESLHDTESLELLINKRACTSVNVRISKCGGLIAAYNRCLRALEAGMIIQIGCQVGETSLLSAAQLILISAVEKVTYAEGCFGLHLLSEDPVSPLKQFGYGGSPPAMPEGPGLGISVNEEIINRYSEGKAVISNK